MCLNSEPITLNPLFNILPIPKQGIFHSHPVLSGSHVFVFVLLNTVVLEEFRSAIQDGDDGFKDILEFLAMILMMDCLLYTSPSPRDTI